MEIALVLGPLVVGSVAIIRFPQRPRKFWLAWFVVIALVQLAAMSAYRAAPVLYMAILNVGLPWLIVLAFFYLTPYPRARLAFSILMPPVWLIASFGFSIYGLMIGVFHE